MIIEPRISKLKVQASRHIFKDAKHVVFKIDQHRLNEYNLDLRTVVNHIYQRFPKKIGNGLITLNGQQLNLVVNSLIDYISVNDIYSSFIENGETRISLRDIMKAEMIAATNDIIREDQSYVLSLSFDFSGRYQSAIRYLNEFIDDLYIPLGYKVKIDQFKPITEGISSSIIAVIIAVLIIYLLSIVMFESFRSGLVILLSIPAALSGVFLIYFVSGIVFTIASTLALIFVIGISVNNSILLVSETKRLLNSGHELRSAVQKASVHRFRPIVLTTMTTIFGLIPLLYSSKLVGEDLWQTISITLIGGLLSSMVFVLTIFPALIYAMEKDKGTQIR